MYYRPYATMSRNAFTRNRGGCITTTVRAVEAVRPGMLVESTKRGIKAHSVFEGLNDRTFVLCGIESDDARESFEPGDLVPIIRAVGNAGVFALVKGGEVIRKGQYLSSFGDGTLIGQHSPHATQSPVAYAARALEDVDLTERDDAIVAVQVIPQKGEKRWLTAPRTLAPGEV